MNHVTPGSVKSKKKTGLGLFGRKKSKDKRQETSRDASQGDEHDPKAYETDSDDDAASSLMAPGQHYTTPKRTKSGSSDGKRGRDLLRGQDNTNSDRSRSRSRSVSSAFRKLVGGSSRIKSKKDVDAPDESSSSKRGQRKIQAFPDEASLGNRIEAPSETPRVTNKKKKKKDEASSGGSLTGIEISIHDDESLGPLVSPAPKKKKKSSKKKKDKDSTEDDGSASKDSFASGSKRTSRSKKGSVDGYSAGDTSSKKKKSKSKKSHREFDVVDRAMKIKQRRASVQGDLRMVVKQRDNRTKMMEEFKEKSSSGRETRWENEEYLISPNPGRRSTLDDSFNSEVMQEKPSTRSMFSDMSSQKKSVATISTDADRSLYIENEDTIASLSETVASLTKQVENQQNENSELQKSLADALEKIERLIDDLRRRELDSTKAMNELNDLRREVESVTSQNVRLHKSLDNVEQELATKEDQLDSMEQVVDEHLDRVELLEKKLEETEEELFGLEEELKKAEAKGIQGDAGVSSHGRLEKVHSIRVGRLERMESKKNLTRGDSVRDLMNGSLDKSSHNKKVIDLASWERKLEERERQLQVARERDQTREERLEEWEKELLEKEMKLRTGPEYVRLDVLNTRDRDLEERARLLKISEEKLYEERDAFVNRRSRFHLGPQSIGSTADEKDILINDLKAECEDLIAEKEDLVRKYEEEEKQREEDLQMIQDDINERLRTLEVENEQLREQLEEAEVNVGEAKELRKRIAKLQTEVVILKKSSSAQGKEGDMLRGLQQEVTQQLVVLDEENRNLSEKLVEEQKIFRRKLKQKDETILELEEMLEEFESGQNSRTRGLADENKSQALADALENVKEKQADIDALQKRLSIVTEEFEERNAQELLGKDSKIRQLEDELMATRAVIEAKTSDQLSMEMKAEIKSLKQSLHDLNKRIKQDQQNARSMLNEKENALSIAEREVTQLKQLVERKEQREKQRAATSSGEAPDQDLLQHIEDLEDEVDHWKKVNIELEDELAHWRGEANELRMQVEAEEEQDLDDNVSIGSYASQLSKQSLYRSRHSLANPEPLNMSHHSFSSLSKQDLFFVSDTGVPDSGTDAGSVDASSSQRAMRTVTDLWSKMTMKQPPSSSGLYQRSLDD